MNLESKGVDKEMFEHMNNKIIYNMNSDIIILYKKDVKEFLEYINDNMLSCETNINVINYIKNEHIKTLNNINKYNDNELVCLTLNNYTWAYDNDDTTLKEYLKKGVIDND